VKGKKGKKERKVKKKEAVRDRIEGRGKM